MEANWWMYPNTRGADWNLNGWLSQGFLSDGSTSSKHCFINLLWTSSENVFIPKSFSNARLTPSRVKELQEEKYYKLYNIYSPSFKHLHVHQKVRKKIVNFMINLNCKNEVMEYEEF